MRRPPTRLWLLSLFVSCLFPLSATTAPILLESVRVSVMNNPRNPEAVRRLVPFVAGEKVEPREIVSTLDSLKKLETVMDVRHSLSPSGKNAYALDVQIMERRIIRDVRVSGNFPFLNKDFLRLIPLQPGVAYAPGYIEKSIENIDAFLRKQGFFDSQITISPRPHKKFNTVDLRIRIKKGKTYRVNKVFISGNKHIRASLLRNKVSRFFRFRPAVLKKNLKSIKKVYSRRGYVKARVALDNVVFDHERRKVDIYISVRENKKLELNFAGKTGFKKTRLRRVLGFRERRAYDSYSIRASRRRLEDFYRQNGYPDAKIGYKTEKTDATVRVTYFINRGQRVELAKIRFEGNENFGGKHLKKRIKSRESRLFSRGQFRIPRLLKDRETLETYYREQGFFNAEVDAPVVTSNDFGDQIRVTFPIREGTRYEIGSVRVNCDLPCREKELLKTLDLKPRTQVVSEKMTQAKARVFDALFSAGYAYAEVEFAGTVNRDGGKLDLDVNVKRGPLVRVRRISVAGNNLTKQKTVLNNLRLKEGGIFSLQKVLDAQLNLRRLGIFSTVKIETLGLEEKKDRIDLFVYVNELKTYLFKMQAGFDNRNLGRGELVFTKRNLFGRAKQLTARAIAGKRFNRGEVTFYSPRLFGASWNLANQYFGQYEDAPNFNAYSYGAMANTLKNFGPHWTVGFKDEMTRTEVIENESNVALLGNALFDNTFNELGFFASYDNRDNFSDPQKGFYVLLSEELNTDMSDLENNFNTVEANLSHHQGFLGRFTLNNTVRYGHHFKVASRPRIPVNKLFFLGGADTIRGFSEDALNPAGGTVFVAYNAELHLRVFDTVKLAGFFDAGFLGDNINAVKLSDIRESAGAGLRYFTPVGPLRLDYGVILDRRAGEPVSRLHFSFGYFF